MSSTVDGSLKEALFESLNESLSNDRESRFAAEQRLQALEVTEEYGLHLTEIVVNQNNNLAIRQLASVLLKQYVEAHWCSLSEKFRPPEVKANVKERIKDLVPVGLSESISKVRLSVAYVISKIAHWEWPENWPGLFDVLVKCLAGDNNYAVHGAMRVLTEFTRDLTDTHFPNVGPVILQEMYRIVQNENQYSIQTRARAIEIFTTIATLVAEIGAYHKGYVEQHLQPLLPAFCEKFVQYLSMPFQNDYGMRTEIIKSITNLVTKLPKYMVNYLTQILPTVWNTLTHCVKIYQDEVIKGDGHMNSQEIDSDGEVMNLDNLIVALFDLLGALTDDKKFKLLLRDLLPEITFYLIMFMQVTEEQIDMWVSNPSQFIQEDDLNPMIYNVRISAQELLTSLIAYADESTINALCSAVSKHIDNMNNYGTDFWKIFEACIVALNVSKNDLLGLKKDGKLLFDITRFLSTVVLPTLNDFSVHSLLLGRCLCMGGSYANEMPPEINSKFLEAIVNGLQENQSACIRISAAKAIYLFSENLSENASNLELLRPQLPNIFQGLFSFADQSSKEVISLVISAMEVLIPIDQSFIASIESKLSPFIIAVFIEYHSDPEVLLTCQDIFKELTKNPECINQLQIRILPSLMNMMNITSVDKLRDDGKIANALDILQILVKYSPSPLSSVLMQAFPVACHCILYSTDNGILQSGGEVLRSYLLVSAQQVIEFRDNEGITGLQYILQVTAELLNPQSSEFTAAFVGKLVTTLINKVGTALGENLDLLLKAVLSKMQRTESLAVMQSLIMIYAHLINSQFDAVLNFLSTVPGPTGHSALEFVLTEWTKKQQSFYGNYERKVATIALSKILEFGVTHDDNRLNEIIVDGDQVISDKDVGVKTRRRAQSQPAQYAKIPLLVKVFKLIIYELECFLEVSNPSEDDYDSSDDEGENEENIIDPGMENYLSPDGYFENDSEDEKELDEMQDSLSKLDFGQYLKDFLKKFSMHHAFPAFTQQINNHERKTLHSLNVI